MGTVQTAVKAAMRFACLILVVSIASVAMQAQSLEVSLSPISPTGADYPARDNGAAPLGALRFDVSGGQVQLDGIVLTVSGTGDFEEDLDREKGLRLWLNDSEAAFNTAADTLLATAKPRHPRTGFTFDPPLLLQPGVTDIWVVMSFHPLGWPRDPESRTYITEIAAPTDVLAGGTAVSFGLPAPKTNEVSLTAAPGNNPPTTTEWPWCSTPAGRGAAVPWALLVGLAGVTALRRIVRGASSHPEQ
jgi:hypothetical protein